MPVHYIKSMQNLIFNKTGISSHYIRKKIYAECDEKSHLRQFIKNKRYI